MPQFVADRLLDPLLPAELGPLLAELAEFDGRCRALRDDGLDGQSADPRIDALRVAYDQLAARASGRLQPRADTLARALAERAFSVGVLLLSHYAATVVDGAALLDTHGSNTMRLFGADVGPEPGRAARLRRALDRAFGLGEAEHGFLDAFLEPELRQLALRQAVIQAVDERYGLSAGAADLSERVFALFTDLYQGHPLDVGHIGLVRTGTSLFFALPKAAPEDGVEVATFLDTMFGNRTSQLGHFPVFGCFRGEGASATLLQAVATTTGRSRGEVAHALTTMVSALPRGEVDKYLLHDAWGHQWQAHLLPFEEDFRAMSRFGATPPAHRVFDSGERPDVALVDVVGAAARLSRRGAAFSPEQWDPWIDAVLAHRLGVVASGMVAEALADAVEYKFVAMWPDHAGALPSSSFFKHRPLKLDVSLGDLRSFFRIGTSGLRRLVARDEAGTELAEELGHLLPGASADGIAASVSSLRSRLGERLRDVGAATLVAEPTAEGLRVNPCTRMAANLLSLNVAVNEVYERLSAGGRQWSADLPDFRDLLVLSAGGLHQLAPAEHFWHLDEYVLLHFEELLDRFLAALAQETL